MEPDIEFLSLLIAAAATSLASGRAFHVLVCGPPVGLIPWVVVVHFVLGQLAAMLVGLYALWLEWDHIWATLGTLWSLLRGRD